MRRYSRFLLIPLLAVAALLNSCTLGFQSSQTVTERHLYVETATLPAEGGSMFVRVQADGVWTLELSEGSEWASVSPSTKTMFTPPFMGMTRSSVASSL